MAQCRVGRKLANTPSETQELEKLLASMMAAAPHLTMNVPQQCEGSGSMGTEKEEPVEELPKYDTTCGI